MTNPTTIIELEGLTLSELIQLREQIQSEICIKPALDADVASDLGSLQNLERVISRKRDNTRVY